MPSPKDDNAADCGTELIRRLTKTLPDAPGVYRMLGGRGEVLYVGKARSLKKRVMSYTHTDRLPVRLQRMVAATHEMMFVRTHTEAEALLLESNLIKKLKPHYNVLLRDDKSFPYILITGDHDFPLLAKHRGARKAKGEYFGPFASAGAVNSTVVTLQKAFMLRNCTNGYFAQRTRPCLQYHIKRCTAPCVGLVSKEEYARQVNDARDFLKGKSRAVQDRLNKMMQGASERMDYEAAAELRDRIRALTAVQARQDINVKGLGDADVVGLHCEDGRICIQVFFFRGGQNFGNRAYFPRHAPEDTDGEVMSAFLAQFYENKPVPKTIIASAAPDERKLLEDAFSLRREGAGRALIETPQRGTAKRLADFAVKNAQAALAQEQAQREKIEGLLTGVAKLFDLREIPQRVEIYDNSHTGGDAMTGAMVVAGPEGFRKNAYRKFNIREADKSDDYGMMREVMRRRFRRALKEEQGPGSAEWPDLLLIDGGQGQLNSVLEILKELEIDESLNVVSIAKGPERNAGRETFFMAGKKPFQLPPHDPVLHYLQRLRDEAHRFVIGAQRTRRTASVTRSVLDDIPGIGAARKKALLHHFGSAQEAARAGLADLEKVPGVSKAMALRIYEHFHEQ